MNDSYDDVYELLRKFTDDNIKSVASWIVERKTSKHGTQEQRAFWQKLNNLRVLGFNPEPSIPWENKKYWNEISSYCEAEFSSLDFIKKIQVHIKKKDKLEFLRTISKEMDSLPELVDEDFDFDGMVDAYLCDPEHLITDIIDILTDTYNKRVAQTRIAISNYTEPHKIELEKLQKELSRAEAGLARLMNDESIAANDKAQIDSSLREKINELNEMKKRELHNIRGVKAFIEEIRSAQERFNSMIDLLERKNTEARSRKDYIALISSLNAKIPSLENAFQDLSSAFRSDITSIKEAFFLLNLSVKDDLIRSIEDQNILTGILGTSGEGIAERISEKRDMLNHDKEAHYEIDLSFLKERSV